MHRTFNRHFALHPKSTTARLKSSLMLQSPDGARTKKSSPRTIRTLYHKQRFQPLTYLKCCINCQSIANQARKYLNLRD